MSENKFVKTNRIGEEMLNNFGSKMIIVGYRSCSDIDVYFPYYSSIVKNVRYDHFKNGNVKCDYEPRIIGHGWLGKGKYKMSENGKDTRCYDVWHNMLRRCYDDKLKKKHETYKNCILCEEWHDFQVFAEWYEENYYEIEGQRMHLDKDILVKGNKVYSPCTCVFVPNNINTMFTKSDKARGKYPIGVTYYKLTNKYLSACSDGKKRRIHLGYFYTPEEAFYAYKICKEKIIKQISEEYKDKIPSNLYYALNKYEVKITD